jgi:hypothetical protein
VPERSQSNAVEIRLNTTLEVAEDNNNKVMGGLKHKSISTNSYAESSP